MSVLIQQIASECPGRTDDTKIKINLYLENMEVSEESLEAFLAHNDLPSVLSKLQINIADKDCDKSVLLEFFDDSTKMVVESTSETWVNGMSEKIQGLLSPKKRFFMKLNVFTLYFFKGFFVTPFIVLIGYVFYSYKKTPLPYVQPVLAILVFMVFIFLIKFPKNQIFIKEKRLWGINEWIGIAILVVTILGVIISIIK